MLAIVGLLVHLIALPIIIFGLRRYSICYLWSTCLVYFCTGVFVPHAWLLITSEWTEALHFSIERDASWVLSALLLGASLHHFWWKRVK
jgi:hypothetical protein